MPPLNNLETPPPEKDPSAVSADDLDEIACVIEDTIMDEEEAGPAGQAAAWTRVHELVVAEARRMREASR